MNIVVAGRETAGWLAALHSKRCNPDAIITVLYDDKIPIIDVAESTTPDFSNFMEDVLDISLKDLVKNCEATIKNSIKFTNWKGDGTYYHHSFTKHHINLMKDYFNARTFRMSLDRVDECAMLSRKNKVAIPCNESDASIYNKNTNYGLHFNSKKMVEYLQTVGVSRGIKIVIGKIEDVSVDKDGYTTEIILDTKQRIKTDFVFDCTGFDRLFVDKVYKSPLKSYNELLPLKKIMPFFIDNTGTTPPFTESIAMKYGWMWKIPDGKRYGCGYVFDSDYINDEEAYEEICEMVKEKPQVSRTISFKPEYNTKPFNKNTLALGLAHGFLEPLESTSLMITIHMLHTIQNTIPSTIFDHTKRESYTEDYNKYILSYVENCVNMLYVHYLTPRDDTDFWCKFKETVPEQFKRTLKLIRAYDLTQPSLLDPEYNGGCDSHPFNIYNIIKCMSGVDYLPYDIEKRNQCFPLMREMGRKIERLEVMCEKSKDHDEYINDLNYLKTEN